MVVNKKSTRCHFKTTKFINITWAFFIFYKKKKREKGESE